MFNPQTDNKYCPYIIEKENYYLLPERESKISLIPLPIVNYLNTTFSQTSISIYLFLYSMNNWFEHEQKAKEEEYDKKGIPITKKTLHFIFTLKEIASNIGINVENWDKRNDLWQFDIEKARTDDNYRLGIIPASLLALRSGNLIDWVVIRNK